MDFERFVLGLRFPIQKDLNETEENAWNQIFCALSAKEAEGLKLHQRVMECDDLHKEPALLCVLSNMSLGYCRKVYARLSSNPSLSAMLMLHEPYILSNLAESMDDYKYLGCASSSGELENGEISVGKMRFCGNAVKKISKFNQPKTILLAVGTYADTLSSEQTAREIMRIAGDMGKSIHFIPFPMPESASDAINKTILALGGRYTSTVELSDQIKVCGVLPDRTVAFSACTADAAKTCIEQVAARGYTKFLIGIDAILTAEISASIKSYSDELTVELWDASFDTDAFLDRAAVAQRMSHAHAIICGNEKTEGNGRFAASLRERCRKKNKKCYALPYTTVTDVSTEHAVHQLASDLETILNRI